MSRVMVLRHVLHESAGTAEEALQQHTDGYEYLDLAAGMSGPRNMAGYGGLLILGGPMSANDPFGYISRELYLIEEAIRAELPVLGICLGAQLIAKAAGSRVYRNPEREIGWFELERTPESAGDPLMAHFQQRETVFQWHSETFDLPAGAAWLAKSRRCRNQAFRLGSRVWGFQFHVEVTPAMIAEWVRLDEACGESREAEGPIDPDAHAPRLAELSGAAVAEWARLI